MIFRNSIYIYYTDIYTGQKFSTVFYEEIYHMKNDKSPFKNSASIAKILQFLEYKKENYLYINIPKMFFIDNFEIEIFFDKDLIKALKLKNEKFTFKYDKDKDTYEDRLDLFKEVSIKIELSDEEIIDNIKGFNSTDMHNIYKKPTFYQYKLRKTISNLIDLPESIKDDFLSKAKNIIIKGDDIWDYLYDCKISKKRYGLFDYEKFYLDDKLVLAICCSMLVDYNHTGKFTENYI